MIREEVYNSTAFTYGLKCISEAEHQQTVFVSYQALPQQSDL